MTILHWFRRDLRLSDNTALHHASKDAGRVIPFFCLDPAFLERDDLGAPRVQFLLDSLHALSKNLETCGSRLILRHGNPTEEITRLIHETGARAVYWNRDYQPHSIQRDQAVEEAGLRLGFLTKSFKDLVLHEKEEIRTGSGTVYTVFTPYSKNWRTQPKEPVLPAFKQPDPDLESLHSIPIPNLTGLGFQLTATIPSGGEKQACDRLRLFVAKFLPRYQEQRDFPSLDATSQLSPHLKFGTLSPRTVYHAATKAMESASVKTKRNIEIFIHEIIWRDFYMQVLAQFPFVAGACFRPQYDRLNWENNPTHFAAWCAGHTGYPIVDAAMRQLNSTGWMHNRLRMITAMFLTKDLLVDWRRGEKYFMQHLVDGDLAANNGGWQWSSGTGTDAAPYFRIFSPVSQSRKFDPNGNFIRKYVPELDSLSADEIHAPWEKAPLKLLKLGYPLPIVDHHVQRLKALAMFKKVTTR